MRSLINFIIRHHFFILFILIETLSIGLVIQYNFYQRASFINFTRHISNVYFDKVSGANDYWRLRRINNELSIENAKLKNSMIAAFESNKLVLSNVNDSIYSQKYNYIPARVINNSINKQFNFITLNKGSVHGIEKEMGVISSQGIVGVVKGVSDNFSTVISLLNPQFSLSVKLKKNNYFGSLKWEERNYRSATLRDIPHHVLIELGDTIITSGFSSIFPEGIMVGVISGFSEEIQNFHEIEVELSTNFKTISYVEVVGNLMKEEQKELEEQEND